jgi:mono/diheme cytochrome c family protein
MTLGAKTVILLAFLGILSSCFRGTPSEKTPIHLNPNMDDQPRYESMEESRFFADRSSLRMPVPGTVARSELQGNAVFWQGKSVEGSFVKEIPFPVTSSLVNRGRERFNIYCTPCHGAAGDGTGIVVKKGFMPPPTFHQQRLSEVEDGYLFDVISHGFRNMPTYGHQVAVSDRWAIVAYIRRLQGGQNARWEDIPEELRSELEK